MRCVPAEEYLVLPNPPGQPPVLPLTLLYFLRVTTALRSAHTITWSRGCMMSVRDVGCAAGETQMHGEYPVCSQDVQLLLVGCSAQPHVAIPVCSL